MINIGFLLQTHNKPHQTRRLIERLVTLYDYPRIVCHHDFSQCDLDTTGYPSCVQFVRPHVHTAWGRISSVEATVAALRLLMDSADAPDWFIILSGADYPVAPPDVVRADLENSRADALLHHFPVDPADPKTPWERTCIERYLHKVIHVHYLNRRLRPSWRPMRLPRWLSRPFLPFTKSFRCYAGWNWFSGNRRVAEKILAFHDNRPALARHYSRLWCVDESYFHCILCNDPSLRLINDNKRFTEWEEGSPHPNTLTLAHLPKILASGCHFARKFDIDQHANVLDALDEYLEDGSAGARERAFALLRSRPLHKSRIHMNYRPLVSIIIPCYTQAQYLAETIDSALAQTYAPVEILVVNDGSPDDTEKVAKSYGDKIVYIYRPNGGLSAARNTAIGQAKGRFLKFLDSDDQLHPEQIARQVEALAGREDCLALTATRLYRDGKPEEFLDHLPQATALLPDLFRDYDWGAPIAWLFPTNLVKAVSGFDESFRFFEDLDLLTKLGARGVPIVVDRRIGCYYRQRPGSMSANQVGMASARARIFIRLHDQLRAASRPDWFGMDLLKAEQAAYQHLVQLQVQAPELLDPLLERIGELQARVGFGQYGWRFRLLSRLLGYARAEGLRSWIVRRLKIKPPASLDTQAWRYQT